MDILLSSLNAVLPIFIMLLVGFLCRRTGLIKAEMVAPFNKIAFTVFLSCATFNNIYTSDFSTAFNPKLIVFTIAAVLIEFFGALLYAEKRIPVRAQRGVFIQGVFRSNYTIIGLSFIQCLMGETAELGTYSIILAFIVPCFNVLAVISLEKYNGSEVNVRSLLLGIAKNPLIIAAVLGSACKLLPFQLPSFITVVIRDFGRAASPVMITLLGAFLTVDGIRGSLKTSLIVSAVRLLLCPAVFLSVAVLLGFRGMELAVLLVVFGSSNAVSSFTMANQMGGDSELAGNIVIITSALCAFTLGIWSFVLKALALI